MAVEEKEIKTKGQGSSLKALLIAAFVAAVPGMYSAWRTADNEYKAVRAAKAAATAKTDVTQERKVRDKQELDIQKYVKAIEVEVKAVKASCVTHKDLLELALKLQGRKPLSAIRRAKPSLSSIRTYYLLAKVRALRQKMRAAEQVRKKAKAATKARPKLKPAQVFRRILRRLRAAKKSKKID